MMIADPKAAPLTPQEVRELLEITDAFRKSRRNLTDAQWSTVSRYGYDLFVAIARRDGRLRATLERYGELSEAFE